MITRIIILSLMIVIGSMGCASHRFTITKVDKDGNATSINEITSKVFGARKTTDIAVNLEEGKVKIGSSEGSAGDLGAAFLNLTEIMKKMAVIP